jgi:hypothetical protein
MAAMRTGLPPGLLFGAVDVGDKAYWWDYGQLPLYRSNNLKMVLPDDDHEASTSIFSLIRL